MFRITGMGLLALAFAGIALAGEPAPPPEPKKLPDEAESNPSSADRVKLRAQLLDLIRQLEKQKAGESTVVPTKPKEVVETPKPKFEFPESGAIDKVRTAQNWFKSGDIEAAMGTFKMLNEKELAAEDRLFVQYMLACCLRKQGKLSEAQVLFREVSLTKDDESLKEYALMQLSQLKMTQELESRLEELRSRKKTR